MTTAFEVEIRNYRLCILKNGYVIFDSPLINIESILLHDKNTLVMNSTVSGVNPKLLGTDHEEARVLSDKISEHIMNYSVLQNLLLKIYRSDGCGLSVIPLSDILHIGMSEQNVIIKRKSETDSQLYSFSKEDEMMKKFYDSLNCAFRLWKRMMLRFEYGNHDVNEFEKQLTIVAKVYHE